MAAIKKALKDTRDSFSELIRSVSFHLNNRSDNSEKRLRNAYHSSVEILSKYSDSENIPIERSAPIKQEERESAEEILAKRISVFPADEAMSHDAIKRNVLAAMEEYRNQKAPLKDTKDAEDWFLNNADCYPPPDEQEDDQQPTAISKRKFLEFVASQSEPKQRMYTEEEYETLYGIWYDGYSLALEECGKGVPLKLLPVPNHFKEYLQSLN